MMHNQYVATGGSAGQPDATLDERALAATGDGYRLASVLAKARRGEPITVGVIGGSITQGAVTSAESKSYGSLLAAWWRRAFPAAAVDFVNAGIGATGSDYGALRVQCDLLSRKPDFVVVEYAVNDGNSRGSAETLEGWFAQTWGGYRQTNIIGKDLSPGPHRIVVELLPDTSEGSTGHEFRILGLGAAGVAGGDGQ